MSQQKALSLKHKPKSGGKMYGYAMSQKFMIDHKTKQNETGMACLQDKQMNTSVANKYSTPLIWVHTFHHVKVVA